MESTKDSAYLVYRASNDGAPKGEPLSEHGTHGMIEAVQACTQLERETRRRHLVVDASGNVVHFPSP